MTKLNGLRTICTMEVQIIFNNNKKELWIVSTDTLGFKHSFNANSKKEILEKIAEEMRGIL